MNSSYGQYGKSNIEFFRSGQPTKIEYLPAEHTLDSRVRLQILYQGRPTTTIAVGDPLEFKLETQEGENLLRDIFATNVIAKDPYSSRSVELIDHRGCPVDSFVFPSLGLSREGDGLKAPFNAFKIPESNFLVFEATVRTCREGCAPAVCDGDGPEGRVIDSFGRRKKRQVANEDLEMEHRSSANDDFDFSVREMFKVYDTRSEMEEMEEEKEESRSQNVNIVNRRPLEDDEAVCLTRANYDGLIAAILCLAGLAVFSSSVAGICFKRARNGKDGSDTNNVSFMAVVPKFVAESLGRRSGSSRNCSRAGNFHSNRYPKDQLPQQRSQNGGGASVIPSRQRFSFLQPDINPPPPQQFQG